MCRQSWDMGMDYSLPPRSQKRFVSILVSGFDKACAVNVDGLVQLYPSKLQLCISTKAYQQLVSYTFVLNLVHVSSVA